VSDLRRLFSVDTLKTAARLLTAGRVENWTFFRGGLAGDVIAPNGRAFAVTLVLDRAGEFLVALCPCSPSLRAGHLCPHLAALVLTATATGAPGTPPGPGPQERFEKSLFFLLARDAFEDREKDVPTWPAPPKPALKAKEQALRRHTETAEEAALERAGVKTNQRAWEDSPWFAWGKGAFTAYGAGWEAFREVSYAFGRLVLRHSEANGTVLTLSPAPSAVGRLLRERDGEFFTRRGQTVMGAGLTPSFRIGLGAGETLRLAPVVLSTVGGREAIRDYDTLERLHFGGFFYLPEEGVFAALERPGPAFAEPEAPPQIRLGFEGIYQPSGLGVPFGRETIVPREGVVPFLARHREELRRLPSALLAPSLHAVVTTGGASGATLRLTGERGGRLQLSLFYDVGGDSIPFDTLRAARRSGQPFLLHGDQLVDVSDESLAWMDELGEDAVAGSGAEAQVDLSALEYLRLRMHFAGQVTVLGEPRSLRLLDELRSEPAAPDPASLGVPLYDFQETGYRWLWFLYQNDFGGLLCDDMGLGKTHQAMALLEAAWRTARSAGAAGRAALYLVVCPTSLLPHWEEKLKRYLPDLPVDVHHGASRRLAASATAPETGGVGGVLLTSYGTLRNDAALLADRTFDIFVLDEMQTLKNRGTVTYQALATLKARFALGLTGTPVENTVGDVKSLLDFVLPGYLPGEAAFRRRFVIPIEERSDSGALGRLQRLLGPFVLRRTKAQVLPDLPAKIVDKRSCSLSAEQQALYREVVAGQAAELRGRLEGDAPIPYLHIFAVLSRLKQICNHPALVDPAAHGDWTVPSGKWSLFEELLNECLASGLKVVVFSQYVRMLDLFEAYLRSREIGFALLKGETVDRAGELGRFRDDDTCRVFLASLRAGGLGVDLTAASVVLHYDRWWNQAREDQATDRVHRLGQKRGVQVLKLITRGTLEERIDELIEKKTLLAGDLVPENDPHLAKQFTREELKGLLAVLGD
jgi:superfamily II DNA or RNA helicase